jgi:hypothetical protein
VLHYHDLAPGVQLIGERVVRVRAHRRDGEVRALHAERGEDRVLHEVFPAALGELPGEVAGRHIHQVVVLEAHPDIAAEGEVLQRAEELFAGAIGAVPCRIVARQSRPMSHQVARRDVRSGVFVVETEIRQVLAHRFVPLELPLAHQRAQRADGELLRDRSDRHLRFGRNRKLLLDVAEAVALRVDDLVADHDGDRRAGNLVGLQCLVDDGIDAGERFARGRFLRVQRGDGDNEGERRGDVFHEVGLARSSPSG